MKSSSAINEVRSGSVKGYVSAPFGAGFVLKRQLPLPDGSDSASFSALRCVMLTASYSNPIALDEVFNKVTVM